MIASNEVLKTRRTKKDDSLPDYKIFETNEFINCLESLPRKDKSKIEKKLTHFVYPQLKKEPPLRYQYKKTARIQSWYLAISNRKLQDILYHRKTNH